MALNPHLTCRPERGFSLVELMVAVVVGLLGILAIMSVFLVSEGQKRTTTGGADAHENALMGLVTMERDLRIAGLGLVGVGCTTINGYNAALGGSFSFAPLPVVITRDTSAIGSDIVTIVYGASGFGNVPSKLDGPMATSDDILNPGNGDGFAQGDLILISEPPKACSLLQTSAAPTLVGTVWTIPHDVAAPAPFNPPLGTNIFPAGGYLPDARVANMGPIVRRQYFVSGTTLVALNQNIAASAVAPTNPAALVEGIIAIRAQYGLDNNADGYIDVYVPTVPVTTTAEQIVAVRIAIVARSGQLEKTAVSPATLTLWNGGTIANGGVLALDATAQLYRYKVYQTTIPLRNVIWTNN